MIKYIIHLQWLYLVLFLGAAFLRNDIGAAIEEFATVIVFATICIFSNKVISHFVLLLAIGKFLDAFNTPNELTWKEIIYVIGTIFFCLYKYKQRNKNGILNK